MEERPFEGRVLDTEENRPLGPGIFAGVTPLLSYVFARRGAKAPLFHYFFCFFPVNNGNPHAPIASSAPNKITASILARPCGAQ